MAYDQGLAEILRNDLADTAGISERRMFGGLVFMLNGNMLCGVHAGGAMYRVGKEREAKALAIDGAQPMAFTGRRMGGFVDVEDEAMADDSNRAEWLRLALAHTCSLPAK